MNTVTPQSFLFIYSYESIIIRQENAEICTGQTASFLFYHTFQGRIHNFWKGVFICLKMWGRFVDFISFFLNIHIVSPRPNYFNKTKLFHFHRMFRTGGGDGDGEGDSSDPLSPLWTHHCVCGKTYMYMSTL